MCAGEFRNILFYPTTLFGGALTILIKKLSWSDLESWCCCVTFSTGRKLLWSQRRWWQSCLFSLFNRRFLFLQHMKGFEIERAERVFWCRYLNQFIYVGCDRNLNCILRQRRRDIKRDNFDTIMLGWARKGKGDISISPLSSLPKLVLTTARFPTCRAIEKDENS